MSMVCFLEGHIHKSAHFQAPVLWFLHTLRTPSQPSENPMKEKVLYVPPDLYDRALKI